MSDYDEGYDEEEEDSGSGLALPGLGGLDVGGLLDGFQRMQETQAAVFEGQAGGGVVRIRANGSMEFQSVEIARDAVDPDDIEMLQDLILAALHDLSATIVEAQRGALGGLDGLDLGNLGNLFGGAQD